MKPFKVTGIVGLDLSLTSTGFARISNPPDGNFVNSAITVPKDLPRTERLMLIATEILEKTQPNDIFFIEDYAYGSQKGANSLPLLGELGGVIKLLLWRRAGHHHFPVAIGTWKKFLCNNGALKKDEFKLQVYKKHSVECKTNDEAAAVALADFGHCLFGAKERKLTKYEQVVITKYKKDHLPLLQSIAIKIRNGKK